MIFGGREGDEGEGVEISQREAFLTNQSRPQVCQGMQANLSRLSRLWLRGAQDMAQGDMVTQTLALVTITTTDESVAAG